FDLTDPKSWDYPGTNPYLYCAANPIMFTDPTGEFFLGTDGERCSYDFDTNTWSENTPEDVKRLVSYLQKTQTGNELFEEMLNSDISTTVDFKTEYSYENENDEKIVDSSVNGRTNVGLKDDGTYSAHIEIFEKTIRDTFNDPNRLRNSTSNSDISRMRQRLTSVEQFIESVIGHESAHATDKEGLHTQHKSDVGREKRAKEKELDILMEIFERITNY
ncbi:MAG: hypothetical protein K2J07_01790, partial [Muribaculaceae bacterium]|nr:hypothetical protein [Muribaculaceae bacterium]